MVASKEAPYGESGVVGRVRQWLEDVEAAEVNPRLRGARQGLSFERSRSLQRDIALLRERLSRLHSMFPHLVGVEFGELLERASARMSVEVK